ncbi:MAG TPA: hypothetical protein VK348_12505, partial [Planctomycetota bacterium]|nr:hypothetical protein [Planctomycetota bacterium]
MNAATAALLAAFRALPMTERILANLRPGVPRKVGGLWGGSAGLLLAVLQQHWRGQLLVSTADDLDSLQLRADLLSFGGSAHVLPRQETDDLGLPEPQSRSERSRALLQHRDDGAPLLAGIEALLQPAPLPKTLGQGRLELRAGEPCDRELLLQQAA